MKPGFTGIGRNFREGNKCMAEPGVWRLFVGDLRRKKNHSRVVDLRCIAGSYVWDSKDVYPKICTFFCLRVSPAVSRGSWSDSKQSKGGNVDLIATHVYSFLITKERMAGVFHLQCHEPFSRYKHPGLLFLLNTLLAQFPDALF